MLPDQSQKTITEQENGAGNGRQLLLANWRRVLGMLFLGFSAGLPLLLIFSTLSAWLTEAGMDKSAVTYFSWAALGYSFKFVWAPIVDKMPLPFLGRLLGRRRSWLLLAQIAVTASIIGMGMSNPLGESGLQMMAIAAVALGFSSATQDIVIDAYRIEAVDLDVQALMSATYVAGYRVGMVVAGAGGLYLASGLGSEMGAYSHSAWQWTYYIMSGAMLVGILTTLTIREPESSKESSYLHGLSDYLRFLVLFAVVVAAFIFTFVTLGGLLLGVKDSLIRIGVDSIIAGFLIEASRMVLSVVVALVVARLSVIVNVAPRRMVQETYIDPVAEFFHRYGKAAILVLMLVGFYRISDIVMGVIANVFYLDMGFSKDQIATITKLFGLWMTILGGFLGGFLALKFGVMRILFVGAVLTVLTNLLFMLLSEGGNDVWLLTVVIGADNLSGGLASAAFIAWLSSLTNISFTAIQYAIFSSLMTLFPKLLGGYSGQIVDSVGYTSFFFGAAMIGVPVLLLIVLTARYAKVRSQTESENV